MSSPKTRWTVKSLIEEIPSEKEELFAYPIDWDTVEKVIDDEEIVDLIQ